MNILFFLIPKSEVAYIFEDETLRQTLEKMEHRKYSCIPILTMDGKYLGTISEGDLLWGMRRADIHDIKETEGGYELEMDLPGFTKDEIKVSLENGYMTISAAKGLDKDEQDKKSGRYIRKERYAGSCERSFYVGEDITEEDIKGEFKHGILTLNVPKKEAKPAVETNKYIAIEG